MDKHQEDWASQIILVTGGAGSIGSEVVRLLLDLGAKVASADSRPLDIEHDRLRADIVDVTKSARVDEWVNSVSEQWGPPTAGVICAGASRAGRLVYLGDEDWNEIMTLNLTGAFYCARQIVRRMLLAGQGGRLVFVGSWAAHAPHPHIGANSASKAALRMLARTLALDHAKDGIMINEVAPGIVNAGLSKVLFEADPQLMSRTLEAIPSGRLMEPSDVARDVAHLISSLNTHTTGTVLVSDGGISLSSVMNPGR